MIWRIGGRRFSLADIMTWLLGMGWAFMWMIPLAWMLSTSFKPRDQILTKVPQWVPQDFTWWNYQTVFEEPMLRWFWNSLVVSVITTLLMLLVASTAGYALARIEFPGRGGLFTTYLMAMIIPFEVLAVPLYLMFAYFNLTDTYFSLIMPMASGSFAVYLFRQFFYALPSELEDAAMIDGCDRLGVFLRIVLPLARPVICGVYHHRLYGELEQLAMAFADHQQRCLQDSDNWCSAVWRVHGGNDEGILGGGHGRRDSCGPTDYHPVCLLAKVFRAGSIANRHSLAGDSRIGRPARRSEVCDSLPLLCPPCI